LFGRVARIHRTRMGLLTEESHLAKAQYRPIIQCAPVSGGNHYHPLTVADVIDETADTRSFVLEIPPALEASFAYVVGQFCTFRAASGGEEVVRCYSMSSSPETGDPFTVTVKRVPGGRMSNWMNDTLAPGDTIDVIPPAGLFVLRTGAETPIVAFAGGSGIT